MTTQTTPAGFPSTRHSLLAQAVEEDPQGARPALNELLSRYWSVLVNHLVNRRHVQRGDAEDLIQGFVASRFLERNLLARVRRERGKFRTFLLTALENYVIDVVRRSQAAKRSPGNHVLDIDKHRDVLPGGADRDAFDQEWARNVIMQALERMEQTCTAEGDERSWLLFKARLVRPLLHQEPEPEYARLIEQLSFDSYDQVMRTMMRAKQLYVRCLREVVAEYALNGEEVDEELRDLKEILAGRQS